MRPLRVYWDLQHGWTADTPVALSGPAAQRICDFVLKVQKDRLLAKTGDAREQAAAALKTLSWRTLHQNLLGSKTEAVLYTE